MVVVRESPRAKQSPDKNSTQWPPKSPFQALLSSPSGRRKWQDRRARDGLRSLSPSPVKGGTAAPHTAMHDGDEEEEDEDEDEDEDEETLQLRLQAIEAKLKLKKLQRARKEAAGDSVGGDDSLRSSTRSHSSPRKALPPSIRRPREADVQDDIQIPLSPTRDRAIPPKEHTSPARARLGLSAMREGDGVSLKRARDATQLKPQCPQRGTVGRSDAPKPMSFSERLVQSKVNAQEERDKKERLEGVRSRGFFTFPGARQQRQSACSATAHDTSIRSTSALQSPVTSGSHPEVPLLHYVPNKQPAQLIRAREKAIAQRIEEETTAAKNGTRVARRHAGSPALGSVADQANSGYPGYDPFTELHLSKRHIPHIDIAREMSDKEIYTLPRLLKEVKAPNYDPPECESDFVVFAVLASKSQPFDQKQTHRTNDEGKPQEDADKPRNKFMVFHLTDLKWEVDVFLFGTAFDQFWKLVPGTLIAILNPAIMPPKGNQNTGRFSLKLGSSEDCVMEIGVARDIAYCASVKKDGQQCGAWIDKRKTEVCEFHLDMMINREGRKGRMEVNSMWRSHQNRREGSGSPPGSRRRGINSESMREGGYDKAIGKKKTKSYHPEYGQLYSIPGGRGGVRSAANLLDAEDKVQYSQEAQEASRKRIAAAQRERDLARKLGEMGGRGVGAEYFRSTNASKPDTGSSATLTSGDIDSAAAKAALFDKPSAASLGLLANKAEHQHLSPAKDRRRHFGLGALSATNGGTEAVGWGGAAKAGLFQAKENNAATRLGSPGKGQTTLRVEKPGIVRPRSAGGGSASGGSLSPKKKRARFALEKGIREPGRESLGTEIFPKAQLDDNIDDDDEDELDIV